MKKTFLYATVFVTGMAVMAVELTASRLMAPYFGSSLFVWTNVIGVVLVAMSVGYWLGGHISDRHDGSTAKKLLYPLILITGFLVSAIPFVGKPIFLIAYQALPDQHVQIFFASLLATIMLFSIPLLLLAMVTPICARIALEKLNTAGSTVGSLYAFSTVGSILGTFLPVLVTMPFLGSRETFFLFGAILMLLGLIGIGRAVFFGFMIIPIVLFLVPSQIHANQNTEFEGESVYNYVRVQKGNGDTRTLHTNEGLGVQSIYNPYRIMTGYYWDFASLLPVLNPEGKDFLIVGLAGGSSARILHMLFPNLNLEGVEIDPLMIEVGKKYFATDETSIKINEGDGRVFLERTDKKYDFVMIDAYKDELYIPFHLATEEFFQTIKSHLTENGSVMMNIATTSADSELLTLLKNTLAKVFDNVYEFRAPTSGNSMLFAFKTKPDFESVRPSELKMDIRTLISKIIRGMVKVNYDPNLQISTDNKSPIEFLTEKMIFSEL